VGRLDNYLLNTNTNTLQLALEENALGFIHGWEQAEL
jgi:hypothetical protein